MGRSRKRPKQSMSRLRRREKRSRWEPVERITGSVREPPLGTFMSWLIGVGDGIRTRDVQSHSLALYQLSYTHHIGMAR